MAELKTFITLIIQIGFILIAFRAILSPTTGGLTPADRFSGDCDRVRVREFLY